MSIYEECLMPNLTEPLPITSPLGSGKRILIRHRRYLAYGRGPGLQQTGLEQGKYGTLIKIPNYRKTARIRSSVFSRPNFEQFKHAWTLEPAG
jgi:hypothetical protein